MFSVGKVGGGAGGGASAAQYYTTGDYYTKGADEQGEWAGKGAERLGLEGKVDPKDLERIIEGKFGPDQETTWDQDAPPENRRGGFDFTFSPPKSVSVMALVAGDKRLTEAVSEASSKALDYLETYALSRQRDERGGYEFERAGNLTYASFPESTSRALDPQLHVHNAIMNATWSEKNDSWTALHAQEMYRALKAADRVALADLAQSVKAMGYSIDVDKEAGRFEIAGVTDATRDLYSKRSMEIDALSKKEGYESAAERDRAWARTRPDKITTTADTLEGRWREEGREAHARGETDQRPEDLDQLREAAAGRPVLERALHAREALDYGLRSATATEAVVEEAAVMREALTFGMGKVSIEGVRAEMDRREKEGTLVRTEQQTGSRLVVHGMTTPEVLKAEQALRAAIDRTKDTVTPLATAERAEAALSAYRIETKDGAFPLSDEQRAAALKVMTSTDRLTVVQGTAGAGKTQMIGAIMAALTDRKHVAVAPTHQAVGELTKATGIEGSTVHALVLTAARDIAKGSVVYADEASMMDTGLAKSLVEIAAKRDFQLVTIGDTKQLPSIGAGRAHETSLEVARSVAEMPTSYRQREGSQAGQVTKVVRAGQAWQEERRLGQDLPKDGQNAHDGPGPSPWGALRTALGDGLKETSRVGEDGKQRTDAEVRAEIVGAVARDWLADTDKNKGGVLVLDNAARNDVNVAIRAGRAERGELDTARQASAEILVPTRLNAEQRQAGFNYKAGDVVVAVRAENAYGIARGDSFSVLGRDAKDRVKLERESDGKTMTIDARKLGDRLASYARDRREIAPGDKIITTAKMGELKNGTEGRVTAVEDGKATMTIRGGKEATIDLATERHWDHAYAITTTRAQGATMETSRIVLQERDRSILSSPQANTAFTRARQDVVVYTDGFGKVLSGIAGNEGRKTSAEEALRRDEKDVRVEGGRFRDASAPRESIGEIAARKIREAARRVDERTGAITRSSEPRGARDLTDSQKELRERERTQAEAEKARRADAEKTKKAEQCELNLEKVGAAGSRGSGTPDAEGKAPKGSGQEKSDAGKDKSDDQEMEM